MDRYVFAAIAIESLGGVSLSARQLISDLGRRISQNIGVERELFFLFVSVDFGLDAPLQSVLLHDSLLIPNYMD